MIDVRSNINEVMRGMRKHRRQIPFAASQAINDTTKDARQSIIKDVQHKQRGKATWWKNRSTGILREFAKKNKLWGSVYTKMHWARLQYEGGTKTPHRGKSIAVPTDKAPKAKKYRKPGGVKQYLSEKKKGVFATPSGVYKSKGRKGSKYSERLFAFVKRAHIQKAKGVLRDFDTVAEKVARRRFVLHFRKRIERAIKTARR